MATAKEKVPSRRGKSEEPNKDAVDTTAASGAGQQGQGQADEQQTDANTAGTVAAAGSDSADKGKAEEGKPEDLTDEVYAEAVGHILSGKMTVDYAVPQMAGYFKTPRAVVEDELNKRVAAAKKDAEAAAKDKAAADKANELVPVSVPRSFQIWIGGGYKLVAKGTDKLPRKIAEDSYAKDNGVKIL